MTQNDYQTHLIKSLVCV